MDNNPDMLSSTVSRDSADAAVPRVTLEVGAYVVLTALALLLRLAAAGSTLLSPDEAAQALAAYHLLHGDPSSVPVSGAVAPTLLALQSAVFFLFGVSDWTARFPIVVLTALSPLTFWLWRPALGRRRALIAAGLLVLSPSWSALGGLSAGAGLAGTALLFTAGVLLRLRDGGSRRWTVAAGFALGLALGSAAEAWAAVVVAALIGSALRLPLPSRQAAIAFVAGLGLSLLVVTVGFVYPPGLQNLLEVGGSLLPNMLHRAPGVLLRQVLLLTTYETLLLLGGLAALSLRPGTRLDPAVRLWTAATVLITLLAGRAGFGLVLAVPGLAVLGAHTLDAVLCRLAEFSARQRLEVFGIAFTLVGYALIALTGIARRSDGLYLLLLLTAVGISAALLALLWARDGRRTALTGASSVVLALLMLWSAASCIQGAASRSALPQELTRAATTGVGMADLTDDLAALSWSRTGYGTELAVAVERDAGPNVAWYLRDMPNVTEVTHLAGELTAPGLISAGTDLELSVGEYVGQDYVVTETWRPQFDSIGGLLRWLLYREAPVTTIDARRVSLWVQTPTDLVATGTSQEQ